MFLYVPSWVQQNILSQQLPQTRGAQPVIAVGWRERVVQPKKASIYISVYK